MLIGKTSEEHEYQTDLTLLITPSFNYKPKQPYLNRYQINQVVIFVTYENPATVKEVMSYINNEFSVFYSHEAVRQLLIKNGLKLLRPVKIPGNPPSSEIQKKLLRTMSR